MSSFSSSTDHWNGRKSVSIIFPLVIVKMSEQPTFHHWMVVKQKCNRLAVFVAYGMLSIGGIDMTCSYSFWSLTIEPHVLGEGLGQHYVVALLNEVAHSPGVTIDVAAGKALIGHVKEREQVPLLWHKTGGENSLLKRKTAQWHLLNGKWYLKKQNKKKQDGYSPSQCQKSLSTAQAWGLHLLGCGRKHAGGSHSAPGFSATRNIIWSVKNNSDSLSLCSISCLTNTPHF